MRAMVVTKYGPPEVLALQEMPDPKPARGQVLVRVKAVGINFADLLGRMGLYPGVPKPPFVPGLEFAGVVEDDSRAPTGSPPLPPGTPVAGMTHFNAYAERIAAQPGMLFRVPAGISHEEAAAMPVNYLTAYHSMFYLGNLQPGDRILIHGAAGGVGVAAVQLAKARGLIIFGTAGPAKQDYLRQIGVHHAIDYSKEDFREVVRREAPDGIEMAMDPIGGKSFAESYRCLGPTGRLVVYGFSAAAAADGKKNLLRGAKAMLETPTFKPMELMARNISVIGVHLGRLESRAAILRQQMDELFRMYQEGTVRPVIGKAFPLAEAAEAHRFIHERRNIGKVVLTLA